MSFIPGPYVSSALICQSSVELLKPGDLTVRGDGEYSRWRCVNYQLLKPQEANPSVWPVCFTSCWPFAVLFSMGVKSVAGKADVFFLTLWLLFFFLLMDPTHAIFCVLTPFFLFAPHFIPVCCCYGDSLLYVYFNDTSSLARVCFFFVLSPFFLVSLN